MQKSIRWWGVLLVAVALLAALPAAAQEEPNVSFEILESGSRIERTFQPGVGAMLFVFHGTEGDEVTVAMNQITDDLDPFLVILGPAGEVVGSDDDGGSGPMLSAEVTATLPVTGSYLIVASSFANIDAILEAEDSEPYDYELTLEGNNLPTTPGFDPERFMLATGGDMTDGQAFEGFSNEKEPVYYYRFNAEEGERINIVVKDADFDTILHVFDSEGNRVAVNDDAEEGVLESAINGLEITSTGTYLVFVTDVFFYAAGDAESMFTFNGGKFTVTLTRG